MENISTILALDLGTTTGWAMQNKDGSITSGTIPLRAHKLEDDCIRFLRFKHLLDHLLTTVDQIDCVYFEQVMRHLGSDAGHCYGGFWSQLGIWCLERNIKRCGVHVKTIKYSISGNGNASKEEVIAAVEALGHKPCDDNEADAIALLRYATQHYPIYLRQLSSGLLKVQKYQRIKQRRKVLQ